MFILYKYDVDNFNEMGSFMKWLIFILPSCIHNFVLEGVYKVNKAHLATSFSLVESLSDSPTDTSLPRLPSDPPREKSVTI